MKRTLIIWLLLAITQQITAQVYKIEVKINNLPNQQLILGHHKNDKLIPVDTVQTNSKAYAVFKGKKTLPEGMYFIFLPNRKYFDFIVGDDQVFKIENDTTDLVKNFKSTGSVENQLFADYQIFMIDQGDKMRKLQQQFKTETDPTKKADIKNQIKEISAEYEKKYKNIQTNYPNTFFAAFLKAARDVRVPDTIVDRYKQYQYYKQHYFDNFDLSDARLLYTPIYEQKIDFYLDKVVPMIPDSINAACDMMLSKTEHDSTLYQYMLVHLYNKYATSDLMISENMFVHLGAIYVKKAYWSPDSFKNELKTKLVRKKNCLIGNPAKPLHMTQLPQDSASIENLRVQLAEMKQKGLEIQKDTTRTFDEKLPDLSGLISEYMSYFPKDIKLYSTHHKYTILWFMSPTCSHCRHDTPLFYDELNSKLKDVDVVVWSVFLGESLDNWAKFCKEIDTWYDFVIENHLYGPKWYNMWNPFDNFRFKYDISSTPVVYILDENKKIIAKKIGYEQAIEIIQEMEKKNKK